MPSPRKKALEDFAKDVERGIPLAEDYIGKSSDIYSDALRARNLAEEALAQKVLDNTGIPIPDRTATMSKKEDFLNQILKERYPEIKKPLEFRDMKGSVGEYEGGKVFLNKKLAKDRDIIKLTSDVLHEGGHGYDDIKKLVTPDQVNDFNKELRKLKASGFDLKNADPAQVYELVAQKHHAQIPKLREGTYGLGALKSYLDSGDFKGVTSPLGAMLASFKDLYKDAPVKANPAAQAKIAKAYEAMKHDPTNPDVVKAYDALIKETEGQFEDLQKNKGLKISRIGEGTPNPYKSSADLIKDVKQNKHMAYFPTETGFGASGAADAVQNNPLLRETKFIGPDGKPMLANDLFRVVHDYYGHVEGENKFGPTGEERAYQQHSKMFSPEAKKALATETRGQNSWVNYGPFGEENRANPANTKYAEQKTGLLPDWAMEDLNKVENPKLARLHGAATLAARALGPMAVASGIVPLAADIKEGKPNTALARAISYAAPPGAEQLTDQLMETAELKDTAPELLDPEYRKMLIRIGQKRMEQGKSPIIKTFSGKEVDTSKTESSDFLNRVKALQELSRKG